MSWQDYFREQIQGLEATYQSQPRSVSLLRYALEQGLLSEEDYLKWAQQHLGKALIQGSFFADVLAPVSLWQQHREKFTWSIDCLPLAEWDGHLIVGALEIPENIPPGMIVLLAPPSGLEKFWSAYSEHLQDSKNEDLKILNASAGAFSNDSSNTPPADVTQIDFELKDEESSVESEASLEAVETLELLPEAEVAAKPVKLDFSTLTNTSVTLPPPPTPVKTEEEFEISFDEPASTPKLEVVAKSVQSVSPGADTGYLLSNWKPEYLKSHIEESFNSLSSHFDRSLLIAVSENESKAKVLYWNSKLTPPQQNSAFNVDEPSILYIATKTAKPFHGPVTSNEVNEKFFEAWHGGNIPAHCTLIPVIVRDQVVALLGGFAESSAYNRATLHFAEKVAKKLSQDLEQALPQAA